MRRLALALLVALLPARAAPQDAPASLVAERVFVAPDGTLVAEGNVQVFHEGATLTATRVTYDREADRLRIEGPILVRDADGALLVAERADLDPRLEDGLLQGARLILDRRLQLAAREAERLPGATRMTAVAATSCQVCPGREPLWSITAGEVTHDEAAQVIRMRDATFRVRGVPVLWTPRLRLPDPQNARETGLLIPTIRSTNLLGTGLKLPIFLELGRTYDLTLTPYLSARTTTLEWRWRQAFAAGDVAVEGAASRDDLRGDALRGYVMATGAFDLGDGWDLAFRGTAVSDDAYLLDYGISEDDRLESSLRLTRAGASSVVLGDLTIFRSLRPDEGDASLPPVVASLSWDRRLPALGGVLTLGAEAEGYERTAPRPGEPPRDLARAGLSADWRDGWVLGPGLLVDLRGAAAVDAYAIGGDPDEAATLLRAVPGASLTLRWPLVRRGAGASDLVEPVASLAWSSVFGGRPPNEDARLVEFDEANLHALDRLPGEDRVEHGARGALGVTWTRTGLGLTSTLAVGRVWRAEPLAVPDASGLDGVASDLLVAGGLSLGPALALDARALVDGGPGDVGFGKAEARVDWSTATLDLAAAYLHLPADADEDRPESAAEWSVETEWRPTERWSFAAEARYDVANGEPARAGLGVGWRNECVTVDLSVARRYTSGDGAEPATDFGLSINLDGFSADGRGAVAPGACRD